MGFPFDFITKSFAMGSFFYIYNICFPLYKSLYVTYVHNSFQSEIVTRSYERGSIISEFLL